jgi:hypothetical protein
VNFKVREMSFEEADRRYAELTRQHDEGNISDEEFDAERRQLMVRDDEGGRWAKIGKSGEWHYRDGGAWVRGTPPNYQEATPGPITGGSPLQIVSPPLPDFVENEENGGRKMPATWVSVAGLGALVGIALIVWVVVPYFRGEPAQGAQRETMSVDQSVPMTADGSGFDAVFVHRAAPGNISANSTYLDNDLINGDPNVVLYITQNWNPGGGDGTYNDHAIGVWYDDDRRRWAIFNQDLAAMPDGSAFNVVVLEAK